MPHPTSVQAGSGHLCFIPGTFFSAGIRVTSVSLCSTLLCPRPLLKRFSPQLKVRASPGRRGGHGAAPNSSLLCFLSSLSFSILSVSLDWSASFSVGFPWEHCHPPLFSRGVTFTLSVPLHALPLADIPSLSSPLSFSPHPAVSSYPPSQPDSSSHSVLRSLIEVIWIWWLGGWREGRLTPPPRKNPKVPVS